MAEVQDPPSLNAPSTSQSSGVDKDALVARLDTLLEQYLHTLDEYDKLMQQLSKQLSSVRQMNLLSMYGSDIKSGQLLLDTSKLSQPVWCALRTGQL